MQHIVLPASSEGQLGEAESWPISEVSLGGVFYDYLCGADETVVGVRYWLMDPINPETHPVYRQFLQDIRCCFHPDGYLDLVFRECDASLLQSGSLSVYVAQDFGGEHVVQCGGAFGIVFDVPAALTELTLKGQLLCTK
jgi:hypothetical protein